MDLRALIMVCVHRADRKDDNDFFVPLKWFYNAQRCLSRWQRWPLVGILPSVGKVLLSGAQIVFALGCFIGTPLAALWYRKDATNDRWLRWWFNALGASGMTAISLGYGIVNICTLSILGCIVEDFVSGFSKKD
jgi:hypothetical protein